MTLRRLVRFSWRQELRRQRGIPRSCQRLSSSVALETTKFKVKQEDRDTVRPFNEIPGPRSFPVFGTMLDYTPLGPYSLNNMIEASLDRCRKYGKIWLEKVGGEYMVNLVDPKDIELLVKNEGKTPRRPEITAIKLAKRKIDRNDGLVNLQGEEWQRLRSAVQSLVMRPKSVTRYIPQMDQVADDFIELMRELRNEDGEVPDFQHQLYKWALESATSMALDTRLGCFERDLDPNSDAFQIIAATTDFFGLLGKLLYGLPIYQYISTPSWKKFVKSLEISTRISEKYVIETLAEARMSSEQGGQPDQDRFLVSLLGNTNLTFKEMVDLPVDIMLGGIDTTAHSLVFNLYTLATNPEKQEYLHRSVTSQVPSGTPITAEMLPGMRYLKASIKESARMFPLSIGIHRYTIKDIECSGYHIPAGVLVRALTIAGMLPEYCPEPDKFQPERWLRENRGLHRLSPLLVLPFGYGPRMCLGRRVAEQELQILLTKLVQNFRIEWNHGKMGIKTCVPHAPDQPARFTFIDRR
ncbi:cytochrome P450 10-like [Ptychodera flava]|uniref:cytochrome P450 10-like n=1 Tax=Ptychodera flava TaxID=63121 RepID=UPI00396A57FA